MLLYSLMEMRWMEHQDSRITHCNRRPTISSPQIQVTTQAYHSRSVSLKQLRPQTSFACDPSSTVIKILVKTHDTRGKNARRRVKELGQISNPLAVSTLCKIKTYSSPHLRKTSWDPSSFARAIFFTMTRAVWILWEMSRTKLKYMTIHRVLQNV